jgi:RNA polymerase sigma-70 factor (ECF subfamily)
MGKLREQARLEEFEREALSHLDTLLRTAIRLERSRHNAEDAVQETYLRAWKYFDSFKSGTNCRAWLFRILFNVLNASRGKQAKSSEVHVESGDMSELTLDNVIVFDPLKKIEGDEMLDAVGRLSEEHRSVLWLVVVEEFSYREAAEILDVPAGTVMSRLHRARRELRKQVATQRAGGAGA